MSGEWRLWNDDDSACAAGTPFRVSYFIGENERFLYFRTRAEAFGFVQDHPAVENPVIKDLKRYEVLYPKGAA